MLRQEHIFQTKHFRVEPITLVCEPVIMKDILPAFAYEKCELSVFWF